MTYAPCLNLPSPLPNRGGTVFLSNIGANGSDGASAGFDESGNAGQPGNPGSALILSIPFSYPIGIGSISLFSLGGNGGEGSDASAGNAGGAISGGKGSLGGAGGAVAIGTAAPVTLPGSSLLNSAVCAYSAGGNGGQAGRSGVLGTNYPSGAGGAGGDVTVTIGGIITAGAAGGVIAQSQGGNGNAGKTVYGVYSVGGDGGDGAIGGAVTVTNNSTINSNLGGITAISVGGNGGAGGNYDGEVTNSIGSGGGGGLGGPVTVTNTGSIVTNNDGSYGLNAYSAGGAGGQGGNGGGNSGSGAAGGTVTVNLGGTIATSGQDAPGVLAQSFGGQGTSGRGGVLGGSGGFGGNGGMVILQGGGSITTASAAAPRNNSQGILAQSIGGGGGNGGDAVDDAIAIGGSGGVAANGGPMSVNVSTQITTFGTRSQGILAQSIGGGGGNGGNATATGKKYEFSIGGTGGGGGNGGQLSADYGGVLQTNGGQSPGLLLQSIGGGGGSGGAAITNLTTTNTDGTTKITGMGIAIALGGSGAGAGDGGNIGQINPGGGTPAPSNTGVIWTTGSDSTGILAQSIGGGGGKGGTTSDTTDAAPAFGSVVVSTAIGGSGAGGGNGGSVTLQNSGMILASGAGSRGMHAQSVGGGGGDGGDATVSRAAGLLQALFQVNTVEGGAAGLGGNGGPVTLTNSGLIITTGVDGDGMLGQSIGGGGGSSGVGDALGAASGSTTIQVGGTTSSSSGVTAAGGNGGAVALTNNDGSTSLGSILTLGDGAAGMLAQSIGGGGGRVGGGAGGPANGGSFSTTATVGASAGSGSSTAAGGGPVVNVTNNGSILTFGADAPGILAQSIGGGGGVFGKGASNLGFATSTGDGGNGSSETASYLGYVMSLGVGKLIGFSTIDNLLFAASDLVGVSPTNNADPVSQQLAALAALTGSSPDAGLAASLGVNLRLGATSAAAGNGGSVQVTNNGPIVTAGRMSTGLIAQSIGGGGGVAGTVITAAYSNATDAQIFLHGSNGDGGPVVVIPTSNSNITTAGSMAPGIVAQSIGGGGGVASLSGASTAVMNPLTVELGGTGSNIVGNGGAVTVNNAGNVSTLSHDSPGIIAQSIGGGGGLVRLLPNDLETSGGVVTANRDFFYNLSLSEQTGIAAAGSAGPVTVTHGGVITTQGNNAYGILAQSIGGGGGAVLGGTPSPSGLATAPTAGNGGNVTITVGNSSGAESSIYTTGQGSAAILAQSIGGGGGLAGDFGLTAKLLALPTVTQSSGNGGAITVTDYYGGQLVTTGNNAPVIFAQSIGGGGGRIVNSSGAYDGTFGGSGTGGPVTIYISGDVAASGVSSPGIFAESSGSQSTTNGVNITVFSGGLVSGGVDSKPGAGDGAGIYIVNTGSGSQENSITIRQGGTVTSQNGTSGTAIFATGTGTTLVENEGTIGGAVILNAGNCISGETNGCDTFVTQADPAVGTFYNAPSGVLQSTMVNLGGGTLTNAGTFDVRAGGTGAATLTGNYHQVSGGVLRVGADFAKGTADHLTVTGNAQLDPGSTVHVDVADYVKGTVPVLTVNGTLSNGSTTAQASNPSYVFGLQTAQSGNTLQVQTTSNLRSASLGLTPTQQSVAGVLDRLWQSGDPRFARPTAALATIGDAQSYRVSLSSLAGASVGGVVAAKQASSERFTDNMIDCDPYRGAGQVQVEQSCLWLRSVGTRTNLANAGDDSGYNQDSAIVQIGGQHEIAPGWFLGASAGYETSWLQGNDDGVKVSGQAALFGVMAKYQTGPWTFSSIIDGGYGSYQSSRQISVGSTAGTASGSPNVGYAGIHGRASYQTALGPWYVRPSMTVSTLYRSMPGYTESGSTPFNLTVKASSDVVGALEPDLEIGRGGVVAGVGILRGFVGIGAAGYINNDWSSHAAFQVSPTGTFTATAHQPDAVGKFRAGVDLFTVGGVDAKLSYEAQFAPGYSAHSIMGRLSYLF